MPDLVPTFRELESFSHAAKEGSFSAAALTMRTSAARVRGNVANLEKKLGLKSNSLLLNTGGRVAPSPQGVAFLRVAHDVLHSVDQLRRDARLMREGTLEELRIGCYPAHLRFVAGAIRYFQDERASSRVEITDASDELRASSGWNLVTRLLRADLDFAIAPDHYEVPEHLVKNRLYGWRLVVGHAEPSSGPVSINDLEGVPLLASPPAHTSHEMLRVACLAAGFSPTYAVESTSTEGLASLARAGLGWAILPSDATYLHRDLQWRPLLDIKGKELTGAYALYGPRELSEGAARLKERIVQAVIESNADPAASITPSTPVTEGPR